MGAVDSQREYQRMLFEKIEAFLTENGYACLMEDSYGAYNLVMEVPGPSQSVARFSLRVALDLPGQPLKLTADCFLSALNETLSDTWTAAQEDSAEEIAQYLFLEFIRRCSYADFSAITQAEIINDTNLEEFADFLSDETLTEEGIYAVGFRIQDEGGFEIAAAASFFFTKEELVVDRITVSDNYEIPGFENYIAQYIYNTATQPQYDAVAE